MLLQRLTDIPGFTEAWSNIASHWPERADEVLGGPYFSDSGPAGTYRVFETRAYTPATYYYMEWLPIDGTANQAITEAVSEEGSPVLTSKYKHWSADPFLFDADSVTWPRTRAK